MEEAVKYKYLFYLKLFILGLFLFFNFLIFNKVEASTANTASVDLESYFNANLYINDVDQIGLDNFSGDYTWQLWWKPESLPGWGEKMTLFSKASSTTDISYKLFYEDSIGTKYIKYCTSDDGSTENCGSWIVNLTPGVWSNITVAMDESSGKAELYINGGSYSTQAGYASTIYDSDARFEIGSSEAGTEYFLDGRIDELRFWTYKRDKYEISDDMDQELTGAEDDLFAYWKFNGDPTDYFYNDLTEDLVFYSTDVPFTGEPIIYHQMWGDYSVDSFDTFHTIMVFISQLIGPIVLLYIVAWGAYKIMK